MKKLIVLCSAVFVIVGCKSLSKVSSENVDETEFVIAFGSCNKSTLDNLLWDDISKSKPDLWIWGGDNIYADTDDMKRLEIMYSNQKRIPAYALLTRQVPIIGTWDDHDYGLNDGGIEFKAKKGSQQKFLDFLEVPKDSPRRMQEGIYNKHEYTTPHGSIAVFVLDTRYFRTAVTPDTITSKRLQPNKYGVGTVLGHAQWEWLEKELTLSSADFNILVSSIQFLSEEHGFETWGNFPHEVERLKALIVESKAKGVLVLSGDRHISEFSKTTLEGLNYPLIDFTSSGLTHAYSKFTVEPNKYRTGKVISTESYGLLKIDLKSKKVIFRMLGDENIVLESLEQSYK